MKNYEKVIVGVVLLVILILAIIVNIKEEDKMVNIPLESSTTTSDTFKDGYMEGCVSETVTYAFCSCSYDSMINHMGKEKLINMSLNYLETNQIPKSVLNNIIEDCSSKM